MPLKPFRNNTPGDFPSAGELNRLQTAAEQSFRLQGGNGVFVSQGSTGPYVGLARSADFWAKLTGNSGAAYAYTQQLQDDNGVYSDDPEGRTGTVAGVAGATLTSWPAYPSDGSTSIAAGTIVRLTASNFGEYYDFQNSNFALPMPQFDGGAFDLLSPPQVIASNSNAYLPWNPTAVWNNAPGLAANYVIGGGASNYMVTVPFIGLHNVIASLRITATVQGRVDVYIVMQALPGAQQSIVATRQLFFDTASLATPALCTLPALVQETLGSLRGFGIDPFGSQIYSVYVRNFTSASISIDSNYAASSPLTLVNLPGIVLSRAQSAAAAGPPNAIR
jgi:hypothetical protein